MGNRPIIQKHAYLRSRKMLDIHHKAPCMLQLGDCFGDVVGCHSDMLEDGKGIGIKSDDCLAVPGCVNCHAAFTRKNLGRDGYAEVHAKALKKYIVWAFQNRYWMVA